MKEKTKAEKVVFLLKELGSMPPALMRDEELLRFRGIGKTTLAEIRKLTGPCVALDVPQYVSGFGAWWRIEGRHLHHGVKLTAEAAWNADKSKRYLVENRRKT